MTQAGEALKRDYKYISDAVHDMEQAQLSGLTVEEVKVDGMTVTPISESSWWLEAWSPQLILKEDSSVELRTWPRFRGSRWSWLGLVGSLVSLPFGPQPEVPFSKVEVTYVQRNRDRGTEVVQS